MIVLSFFAFLSGMVTILSPCILPVLPIVLSGSVGGKGRPLGVVTGFIASFSLFTLILSTIVQTLQIPPDTLRVVALIVITGFGLVLVIPQLQLKFEMMASRIIKIRKSSDKNGFFGGVMVGASLGMIWTPCVGPIMASVIGLAVTQQVDGGAVLIVVAYSLGTSLPMLGIMAGGRQLIQRFPKLSANTRNIQRVFGILMIIVGLSIGVGMDRRFQTIVLKAFPKYGTGLTAFENNSVIQKALDKRSIQENGREEQSLNRLVWNNPPHDAEQGQYGTAPELVTNGQWFNIDGLDFVGERPTMADLKGKVVLLDFWTYSCVNCVRTIPYLKSWYERYKDRGFVIIGVHSPEFAFERDADNVQKAMKELGITWPVVLDNRYRQWRAYNNRYWPAHYFIDSEGSIRYYHFGEGEYKNSEKVIRKLLEEAGTEVKIPMVTKVWEGLESQTPEIYLGYQRSKGFLSESKRIKDQKVEYSLENTPKNGEWNLEGTWTVAKEFIEVDGAGALELGFKAKHVFLVIEPIEMGSKVDVKVDGIEVADTEDVKEGELIPASSRLYQLVDFSAVGAHVLKLNAEGKLRFYAFTFG